MSAWQNDDQRSKYLYPTTYVPAPMTADIESRYRVEFVASSSTYYKTQPYVDFDSYYGPPGYARTMLPAPMVPPYRQPRAPPQATPGSPVSDDTSISSIDTPINTEFYYPYMQAEPEVYPSQMAPRRRQAVREPPRDQLIINLDDMSDKYQPFSNRSDHRVKYLGKEYPTAEHLFQSFKFHGFIPMIAEWIRTCSDNPERAIREALEHTADQRRDWQTIQVRKMYQVLEIKFRQNTELKDLLLATGDSDIKVMGDDPDEMFWGIGGSGKGSNHLGSCLQELRTSFRY